MSTATATAWTIVRDHDGTPHTRCPHCGELDTIGEVDTATRVNTLHLSADGMSATAGTGDADFEFSGWFCRGCYSEPQAPEGFEISDWY